MKEVMAVVQRLAYEQQRSNEREADGRRMLLLEVENQLLKAKLPLPPAKNDEDAKSGLHFGLKPSCLCILKSEEIHKAVRKNPVAFLPA